MENVTVPFDENYCIEHGFSVSTSWLYRSINIFQLFLSIGAINLLLYFLIVHLSNTLLHVNIKVILWSFYLNVLCFALDQTVGQIHMLYLSFYSMGPCEVFLPKYVYAVLQLGVGFTLMNQVCLQTALWIERCIASCAAGNYEEKGPFIGIAFVIISALTAGLQTGYVYGLDDLLADENMEINYFHSPKSTFYRLNKIFLSALIMSAIGVVATLMLYKINRSKKERIGGHLSKRYQVTENVRASEFIAAIAILSAATFTIYTFLSLVFRLKRDEIFGTSVIAFQSARNLSFVLPLLSFLLPVLSMRVLNQQKKLRLKYMIEMKEISTGKMMENIYSQLLEKQWNCT